MNEKEKLAYLAGIMDGEGTISYQTQGKLNNYRRRFTMEVKMAEKKIIMMFIDTFGGWLMFKKRRKPHYKDLWAWRVGDRSAIITFKKLKPYLQREKFKELAKIIN